MVRLVSVFALLLLTPPAARSQSCVDYESQPFLVSTFGASGESDVVGSVVVYCDNRNGLATVDVSNPFAPVQGPTVPIAGGFALHVSAYGSYAYLVTFDGNNPTADNIHIVDFTNPAAPFVANRMPTSTNVFSGQRMEIGFHGNRMLLPDHDFNVRVFDVTDPVNPVFLQQINNPGMATHVVVQDDLAYAVYSDYNTGQGTLLVIDPTTTPMTKRGTATFPEFAIGLSVDGDYAYVLSQDQSGSPILDHYTVFDVTDPDAPVQLGTQTLATSPYSILVDGGYAFVSSYDLEIWDVSSPTTPSVLTTFGGGGGISLTLQNDLLYTSRGRAFDVTSRVPVASLGRNASLPLTAWVCGAVMDGAFAYLATYDGLLVLDLADPGLPVVGSLDTGDIHWTYGQSGSLLYAATDTRLRVLDVTDPTAPFEVGSAGTGGKDLVVVGNRVVVANKNQLELIGVANPSAPVVLDTSSGEYSHVMEAQGRLYATTNALAGSTWLRVYDVASAPGQLAQLTQLSLANPTDDLVGAYPYAYLVAYDPSTMQSDIHTLDLATPTPSTPPQIIDSIPAGRPGTQANAVVAALVDDLLLVGNGNSGGGLAAMYDVSGGPPVYLGQDARGAGWIFADSDGFLAGDNYTTRAELFPLQCTTQPVSAPLSAGAFSPLGIQPNPTGGGALISFAPGANAKATVRVFDVMGRHVATLARDARVPDGRVRWDGKTTGGDPAPAGVYFVRLESGGRVESSKLVLVR